MSGPPSWTGVSVGVDVGDGEGVRVGVGVGLAVGDRVGVAVGIAQLTVARRTARIPTTIHFARPTVAFTLLSAERAGRIVYSTRTRSCCHVDHRKMPIRLTVRTRNRFVKAKVHAWCSPAVETVGNTSTLSPAHVLESPDASPGILELRKTPHRGKRPLVLQKDRGSLFLQSDRCPAPGRKKQVIPRNAPKAFLCHAGYASFAASLHLNSRIGVSGKADTLPGDSSLRLTPWEWTRPRIR
jgi:hypothetical protein